MQSVFVHGLGQGAASWDQTVSSLTEAGRVYRPELPALLGGREATYGNLYRAFEEECQRLPGGLHLCGLSLGAVLALNFAQEHPQRVRSLVLIGALCRVPRNTLRVQNVLFRLLPPCAFKGMGFTKKEMIQLGSSMLELNLSGRLRDIPCRTLVLCGERDKANQAAARQLAHDIPRARLQLIPGAGHEVNTQAPAALAEILNEFYRRERDGGD